MFTPSRHCTYNVTLSCIYGTIDAVVGQEVLYTPKDFSLSTPARNAHSLYYQM